MPHPRKMAKRRKQQTCPNCENSPYLRYSEAMRKFVIAELERMIKHENEVRSKKDG